LGLVDHGRVCTVSTVLMVLLYAAARVTSIFDACQRLRDAPTDQAVRDAVMGMFPKQMPALERKLNDALAKWLPRGLMKKARPVAIDLHCDPYYGKPHKKADELRRGKREKGTSRFHCYATLCVLHKGRRYTLAVTYVWKHDKLVDVVRRLLERARGTQDRKGLGLRVRYLLLDKGFYGAEVLKYLRAARCPFLLPVVHRGPRNKKNNRRSKAAAAKRKAKAAKARAAGRKTGTKAKGKAKGKPGRKKSRRKDTAAARRAAGLTGTHRFFTRRDSGFGEHRVGGGASGRSQKKGATVKIAVYRRRYKTRTGKLRRDKPLVFAFWGFRPRCPAEAARLYRTRYGIEASYRQLNQARARTCCRNPRIRLLLVVLALLLRNLWVWVHEQVLATRRGTGLQLRPHLLRFRTLLLLLQQCAEDALGRSETTSTPFLPAPPIPPPQRALATPAITS
jgi:hypothetical protein